MRLNYSQTPPVDMDTACAAAIEYLAEQPRNRKGQRIPAKASSVADAIWPKHQMNAQGAGGAASRILKRLEKRGRVAWISREESWGWILLRH